jgi:serine/threonine protein kinase
VLQDAASDAGLTERFLREIRVHASLEHPNIAALRTALRVEDRIVMIVELVDGASLAEVLRRGPIEPRAAVNYAVQVLSALAYAHSRGVVHRDIKPANIILATSGIVKVTDFGIARKQGARRGTLTGMASGSIYYMSPEQITGKESDPRSDVYSLGVSLYEMVTGVLPSRGENEYAIMHAHLTQEPTPPSQLAPSIRAELSAMIMKAIAKAPEDRFQSAEAFLSSLRTLSELEPAAFTSRTTATANSRPSVQLDSEQVARIQSNLVRIVGPIARQMASNALRKATSLEELCRLLADGVPDPQEQHGFLRACMETLPSPPPVTSGAGTLSAKTAPALNAAQLEDARRKLAHFIGPLAGIVVDRAARKARTVQELYPLLAAEIPSDRDRASFLASVAP